MNLTNEQIIDQLLDPPEVCETTSEDDYLEYYEDVKGAD